MQKVKSKIDITLILPETLSPKFIKKIAERIGESREDTEEVLRRYIDFLFRKKGGDYSLPITPRQIKETINKKKQLLKAFNNE